MDLSPYIHQITNKKLRTACLGIADYKDFFMHPGSSSIHHGYVGGLAIHTKEVLYFALEAAKLFPAANKDILIAAALWHDFGKIWDYKLETFFADQYNEIPKYHVLHSDHGHHKKVYVSDQDYKNKVHHVTGSTAEFTHHALTHGVDRKTINEIAHCIISHHGRKDWGSIKEPQTLEATLLHQADCLSAHFGPRKDK